MSTLLSLRNLTRRYGGNIAVNDVGFDVAEGEILGIMGANGAGKTTLFAMIAGNVVPSSGQILLDGQAVQGLPPERINALGVSRTFQIVRPFPSMTVLENATVAAMYGRRQTRSPALAREQAMAVLEETGLADRAHLPASQLNLAGRKRLEIARALAAGPRVLLLDEVLAGLNATEVEAALDLIRSVRERHKLSIIIIEHVMKALMRLSDRIVVLHEGRKVVEGLPAEVANDPRVIKAYLENNAMPILLEAQGACAGYGEIEVLGGVDVSIAAGSITAVIGSNGAGKSTLMRSLAGLLPLRRGSIRFDGVDVTARRAHQRVNDGIALVPEGRLVFPDFTVAETLRMGAFTPRSRKGWQPRVEKMYELFPRLRERRSTQAGLLSGGEQQMLALARGLMSLPRVLLLDEPSLGLAPAMADEVFTALRAIRDQGMTIGVVEQNVYAALSIADTAYVMEDGHVVRHGPAAALIGDPSIRQAYLGL